MYYSLPVMPPTAAPTDAAFLRRDALLDCCTDTTALALLEMLSRPLLLAALLRLSDAHTVSWVCTPGVAAAAANAPPP